MSLQVNLTLRKTYFLPGELVQVCVQIFNEAESVLHEGGNDFIMPQVLHIKELSFQANGSERTDSSFINNLHRPEVPAEVIDSRKRVRCIFSTESAVLISDKVLAPHATQSFQLKFRLPAALPPSFRGSAARFFYMIHVKAVYEVQRGKLEAVVYETTASTTLTIWPNIHMPFSVQASSAGSADRRTTPHNDSYRSLGPGGRDSTSSDTYPHPHSPFFGKASDAADVKCIFQSNGVGSAPAGVFTQSGMPLHAGTLFSNFSSSHGNLGNGGDEFDVAICDYVLGRNCRIRWQEIQSGTSNFAVSSLPNFDSFSCATACSGDNASRSAGAFLLPRGVIPFGVNQPSDASIPLHPSLAMDTDSDLEDFKSRQKSAAGITGYVNKHPAGILVQPSETVSHVQRQLSGGPGGLPAFTRNSSRRSSLFGKMYMLNVGEQPLLRLLLHAPLEVPLQPGATFGGVLDFRQAIALSIGHFGESAPTTCYGVAILMETEEVLTPESRPQGKRESGGESSGRPYVIRRLHAEHQELAGDSALTSFMFSLPATATPSFRTPMVSLRWVLRFELTVGPCISFGKLDKRERPMRPQLEHFIWSLPLNVRPPVAVAR